MTPVRVLVVDDSPVAQQVLTEMIQSDPNLQVVGTAANGREAVSLARELQPDLITMDLNMPVMNGQEAIDQIMASDPRPILVISSNNDSKVAFDACARGALDVFSKDQLDPGNAEPLTRRIKLLSQVKVIGHIRPKTDHRGAPSATSASHKIIAIACSTGGPRALAQLLPALPADYPHPIVIAQHIENGFSSGLIEWLNPLSPNPVEAGQAGGKLQPGKIVLVPPEQNLAVRNGGTLEEVERRPQDRYAPNCDLLLSSVAESYGKDGVGVILTGMATDGVEGMKRIHERGGLTIAQDEATSVVYGMNRQAIEAGCIDKILPIQEIGPYLAGL